MSESARHARSVENAFRGLTEDILIRCCLRFLGGLKLGIGRTDPVRISDDGVFFVGEMGPTHLTDVAERFSDRHIAHRKRDQRVPALLGSAFINNVRAEFSLCQLLGTGGQVFEDIANGGLFKIDLGNDDFREVLFDAFLRPAALSHCGFALDHVAARVGRPRIGADRDFEPDEGFFILAGIVEADAFVISGFESLRVRGSAGNQESQSEEW